MNILSPLRRLTWMIWSPSRAFDELYEKPTWLGAYLTISLGTAFIAWISIPVLQDLSLLALSESFSEGQLGRISWINQIIRYASIPGVFLATLVIWFISAFLLWLIIQVFEGMIGFKAIFAIVAHASVISFISGILAAIIVIVKLQNNVIGLQDIEIKLGLDLFWEGEVHPTLNVILVNLNPFNLWYYGLLILGIGTVCRFNWVRSATVVGLFWALSMTFGAGIAWVLSTLIPPA